MNAGNNCEKHFILNLFFWNDPLILNHYNNTWQDARNRSEMWSDNIGVQQAWLKGTDFLGTPYYIRLSK